MTDTTNSRVPLLVIVDDEEMVLISLRSFLALETDYEVLTFDSPLKALESIRENRIDLVISDYLMPEMTGIEFLLEVTLLHGSSRRMSYHWFFNAGGSPNAT